MTARRQLIDLYIDELRASLGQIGAQSAGRSAAGESAASGTD